MIRQLYNVTNKEKSEDTIIEFLQVTKMHNDGTVEFLDLSGMAHRVTSQGHLKENGTPLQVPMKAGDFLMAVSYVKMVRKSVMSHVRVHLFSADPKQNPAQIFVGMHGDLERNKNLNLWRFPQVDAILNLHGFTFEGSSI